MIRPTWIFDLDGTLAIIDHRRPILNDGTDPARWRKFYAACVDDQPNTPVIRAFNTLLNAGHEVHIWSGRSDEVRAETVAWICSHTLFTSRECHARLRMRPASDFTLDAELKRQWLHGMPRTERISLQAVFDDRDSVVAMWRAEGVPCFQVAPGDF